MIILIILLAILIVLNFKLGGRREELRQNTKEKSQSNIRNPIRRFRRKKKKSKFSLSRRPHLLRLARERKNSQPGISFEELTQGLPSSPYIQQFEIDPIQGNSPEINKTTGERIIKSPQWHKEKSRKKVSITKPQLHTRSYRFKQTLHSV